MHPCPSRYITACARDTATTWVTHTQTVDKLTHTGLEEADTVEARLLMRLQVLAER
jgi:hypothetical protein